MSKQILVNSSPYETRVATLEDGEIKSLHIEREEDRNVVGNIYKGLVKRVLPGMQAAFLELGLERTAFLYVDDIIDEPFGTEFDYGESEGEGDEGGQGGGEGESEGEDEGGTDEDGDPDGDPDVDADFDDDNGEAHGDGPVPPPEPEKKAAPALMRPPPLPIIEQETAVDLDGGGGGRPERAPRAPSFYRPSRHLSAPNGPGDGEGSGNGNGIVTPPPGQPVQPEAEQSKIRPENQDRDLNPNYDRGARHQNRGDENEPSRNDPRDRQGNQDDNRNQGPIDDRNFNRDQNQGDDRNFNRDQNQGRGENRNYGRGDQRGDNRNQGRNDQRNDNRNQPRSDNRNQGRNDQRNDNRNQPRGDNRNQGRNDQRTDNRNQPRGDNRNQGRNNPRNDNRNQPRGDNRNQGRNDQRTDNRNQNRGEPRGDDRNQGRGEFRGDERNDDRNQNRGELRFDDRNQSQGQNQGEDRDRSDPRDHDRDQNRGDLRMDDRNPDHVDSQTDERDPNQGDERNDDRNQDRQEGRPDNREGGQDRGRGQGGDRNRNQQQARGGDRSQNRGRGGRGGQQRGAHRRGGSGGGGGRGRRREKRNVEIQDLLKEGQELLVQVAKAPIGTKGARLTTHISLPGRNLVLMPTVKHLGISRRVESERERRRLREIFTKRIRTNDVGFIIRTVAEGKSYRELKADADYLLNLWDQIQDRTKKMKAPALIHEDLGLALKTMRDDFTDDVDSLVIDNPQDYDNVLEFISQFSPRLKGKVKLFRGPSQLFEHYGIEAEISRALGKKVWLKSGGYLLIDQSEALTAIDVNTGRYVGSKSLEETILKTNLEAVKEIAYQLRIRNVGGIIIIDLIDMENAQNRKKVYDALQESLSEDKARTNILKISELGLVEMTRKRTHEDLVRYLTEQCGYCEGRGYHKSRRTICFEIFREIEKEAIATAHHNIVVFANSEVVSRITKEEKKHWKGLEERLQRQIVVKEDPNFHVEQFEVFSKP